MNKKNTALVALNTLTLILMLFVNYASNAKVFFKQTVADISHKYDSLFAPAGYAFAIWGIIFLLLVCFTIYQWILLKQDTKGYIQRTGVWFIIANLTNAAWVYCWVNEWIGWSVAVIFLLLLSLIILTVRLRLELDDESVRIIFFVWWPICFYLGWIMVATIACVSAWLVSNGWDRIGISVSAWTIMMIVVASLIYILLIVNRNMREAAIVGIWAFIAISIRQWSSHKEIAVTGLFAAAFLFITSVIHAYRGRKYSPFAKLKRGEW